jgi:hypothetical protein
MMLAKKHYLPRDCVETIYAAILLGARHQRLHTDTNREHRFFIYSQCLIE